MIRLRVCVLLMGAAVAGRGMPACAYELSVVNMSDRAVASPVTIPLVDLPDHLCREAISVTGDDGVKLPSQVDDTDGDGRPDELVLRVEVPPHSGRKVTLQAEAAPRLPHQDNAGAAWAEYMWNDPHLENRYLRCELPTYWEETDERPRRFPPDSPWPYDARDVYEVRDRRNDTLLLDFTLKPERQRYTVEAVQQRTTGGNVRNTVSRVRDVRDADDETVHFRIEDRFIFNRDARRLDVEIAITNTSEQAQNAGALRVLDGEMGDGLELLEGDRRNLNTLAERRAQLWHNRATGYALGYIPH